MTNEQVAVMIENYCRQLVNVLEQIADELPDECMVEKTDFFGNTYNSIPSLIPLNGMIDVMRKDVSVLIGAKQ